jgi:2-polyprenyl-3-methyl-5-hydroxy-6-metoxy-1,4-benzoquinol methylase
MADPRALEQSGGKSSSAIHRHVWECVRGVPGPLLDLGCGTGEFLAFLRGQGREELTGCDAHEYPESRREGIRFVKGDLNSAVPLPDAAFAVVTAIEVAEHLENPRHLAREMHRLLRPGGLAVVTTPNLESCTSLLSLALRGYPSAFADACYPAHITPILEIDLRRMLAEAGFTGLESGFTGEGRVPGLPWHWQDLGRIGGWRPLAGALGGRRFSDNLRVSGRKP